MYDESHIREDGSLSFYHRTTSPLVIATDDEIYININDQYNTQVLAIETDQLPESIYTYSEIGPITVTITEYTPLKGKSYIKLPDEIKWCRGLVNIMNDYNLCFYLILALKH